VGAFSLLSAFFDRVEGDVEAERLLQLMVGAVETYRGSDKGNQEVAHDLVEKRLTMLSMLYNLRSSCKEKVWILGRIVQLSVSVPTHTALGLNLLPNRNATLGNLLSGPAHLETACFDESVTPTEKRTLYGIIAAAIQTVSLISRQNGLTEEATVADGVRQKFLLKFSVYVCAGGTRG